MDVKFASPRRLSTEELMLLNCGAGEDSWESLGLSRTSRKNIKKVIVKEINWIFIRRTDAEAEAPVLWPPDTESRLIRKDPDAGKDWRQKGTTEDELVGWHRRLHGREFELREMVKDREAWRATGHRDAKTQTRLSNWTTTTAWCVLPGN